MTKPLNHDEFRDAIEEAKGSRADDASDPFTEILRRLERAARNGARAHLDHVHVRAMVKSKKVYLVLNELKQEEMSRKWEEDVRPLAGTSLGNTGSGIAPIATTGASAGSMAGSLAARASASQVARGMIRQKPRSKR